jgi:homoserine kinase
MSALRVRVPASSANLGPGFDALGMALSLHLEMGIDDGSALPEFAKVIDDSHPSLAAFRHAGGTGNVWVRSVIPMGRGLGFSGAARVAGVVLGHAQSNGKESLIRRSQRVVASEHRA